MILPNAHLVGRDIRISIRVLRVFPSLGKLGILSPRDDALKKWFNNLLSNVESN